MLIVLLMLLEHKFFEGIKECSALQTQGVSGRYLVPNPCYTQLSAKIHAPLHGRQWEDIVLWKKSSGVGCAELLHCCAWYKSLALLARQ